MKTYLSTFALAIFLIPVCQAQRPAQGPVSVQKYTPQSLGYTKLIWQDEFNDEALDTSKWEIRGVGKRATGYVSPKAVSVSDGFLKLFALKEGDSILISAVGTQNRFMTKYGYFECRAELQRSAGNWAAFWLQSPKLSEGDNPVVNGAEIDIMEFFKKLGPDIVSHNVHWGPYGLNQHTTHGYQSYLKGVSKGFHTFALEWTPEKYIFYIDGYKFYEITEGISQTEEYIILSMELPNELKDLERTVFPDVFMVDYIRVYKK
ncbi:MAG: glycoside hydrolase family 16 protein [Bacteroidetes bacterium]|nr:glycoside hydrolase family 16 protein [Bacteroidota bacterium]